MEMTGQVKDPAALFLRKISGNHPKRSCVNRGSIWML